jgi:hypothetical protein
MMMVMPLQYLGIDTSDRMPACKKVLTAPCGVERAAWENKKISL